MRAKLEIEMPYGCQCCPFNKRNSNLKDECLASKGRRVLEYPRAVDYKPSWCPLIEMKEGELVEEQQ